tara:strand:- start:112 stop:405 length:294 start_codon:yes stop_codon:yes gene_type:complete
MSFKGTAGKSSSGASMSKYDVEVEGRLQALEKQAHPTPTGATQKKVDDRLAALEKAVAELGAKCDARAASGGSSGGSDARLNKLVELLSHKFDVSGI